MVVMGVDRQYEVNRRSRSGMVHDLKAQSGPVRSRPFKNKLTRSGQVRILLERCISA